jgi:hypothetical protein
MEKFELAKKVRQKHQDEIAFKRSNTMSRRFELSKADFVQNAIKLIKLFVWVEMGPQGSML